MKLVVQPAARSDILRQVAYFAEIGRVDLVDRFLASARQSFERIAEAPHAGSPKYFENEALNGLRSRAIADFETIRAYYLTTDDRVVVLRVLHGRRDIERILDDDTE